MKSKNMWGDLKDLKTTPTPRTYIKEQASNLTQLTGGILRGEVISALGHGDVFSYGLVVVAPRLNDYKKTILVIGHDIAPYPAEVTDYVNEKKYSCKDESGFLTALGEILSSPKVRNIIESLISHSK